MAALVCVGFKDIRSLKMMDQNHPLTFLTLGHPDNSFLLSLLSSSPQDLNCNLSSSSSYVVGVEGGDVYHYCITGQLTTLLRCLKP
jgi:hypothetical protein